MLESNIGGSSAVMVSGLIPQVSYTLVEMAIDEVK
jgi:hypothetical protein